MFMVCDMFKDWVVGLDKGVDDYIVKFFDSDELCVWIRMINCWVYGCLVFILEYGVIVVDFVGRVVIKDGVMVDLFVKEFVVL